jgi:hypothetical protein
MALTDFERDIREAMSFLVRPSVESDSERIDPAHYAGPIHGADLWLATGTVSRFNVNDWAHLPAPKRMQLEFAVARFNEIASVTPGDQPVPQSLSNEAETLLRQMATLIGVAS